MAIYASKASVDYAQALAKAFPTLVKEAIDKGVMSQTDADSIPTLREGISRQYRVSNIIDAILSQRAFPDFRKKTSAQAIIAEEAYRYAKAENRAYISTYLNASIRIHVERTVGRLQDPESPKALQFGVGGNLLPHYEAITNFNAAFANIVERVNKKLAEPTPEPQPTPEPAPEPEPVPEPAPEPPEAEEKPKPTPVPDNGLKIPQDAQELREWIASLHPFWADRAIVDPTQTADSISIRTFRDAANSYKNGIPVEMIKATYLANHNPATKKTAWALKDYTRQHEPEPEEFDFDPLKFNPRPSIPGMRTYMANTERYHAAMGYWLTLNHAHRQGFVFGPTGTGKTTIVADGAHCIRTDYSMSEEEFPFGFISLTRGTAPSAFNGRPIISNTAIMIEFWEAMANKDEARMKAIAKRAHEQGDVVISVWQRVYGKGGVMLLDEADNADQNLILTVNAAMANDRFSNTATGEIVHRHPNCYIWLAGNTPGTGATSAHPDRNRMDKALLDRVRMSTFKLELDIELGKRVFDQTLLAESEA